MSLAWFFRNEVPCIFDESYAPLIGKAMTIRTGRDVTMIANGLMVSRCLEAANRLEARGVSARVLEMHTVKPLDAQPVLAAAAETGAIVTAEEATMIGGLGGAVAETVGENYPVPVIRVGLPDTFAETGPYELLLDRYGMSVDHLVEASKRAIAIKNKILV